MSASRVEKTPGIDPEEMSYATPILYRRIKLITVRS